MRVLEELPATPLLADTPAAVLAADHGNGQSRRLALSWIGGCQGLLYDLTLIVPSFLFVVYLASRARKSLAKLTNGGSHIMMAYYGLLWLVSLLNFLWCILQAWQCSPTKEFSWNMLSLFTKSGMLFMEVSLLAFLLQGNHAGGLESLTRTFIVSGVIVSADILLKAIYIFGFGVPLFIEEKESLNRVKWGLWIFLELLLTAVYGFIFFMHHSKWRERLPARPAFYKYICTMLSLYVVTLFACVLVGSGIGFGFWLFNLTTVCYHSLYLPFLYVTFLADFFQEEDMRLENVYYSEMKDAGFFDVDWD